jgi:hypothetical protein
MRYSEQLQAIEKCPRVIACSYRSEGASLRAYQSLLRALCINAGVMHIQSPAERHVAIRPPTGTAHYPWSHLHPIRQIWVASTRPR